MTGLPSNSKGPGALTPRRATRLHKAPEPIRAAAVLASITKLGAATILDVAADAHLNKESVRRYVNELLAAGRLIALEQHQARTSALYAPAEPDDAPEFDLHRVTVPAVQLGMWRDRMDCFLFGPAGAPAQGAQA